MILRAKNAEVSVYIQEGDSRFKLVQCPKCGIMAVKSGECDFCTIEKEEQVMIYVYDNGRHYSDHALSFVQVPDKVHKKMRDEIIETLEHVPESYYGHPNVIAIATNFEWRHPHEIHIESFLYDLLWMADDEDYYSRLHRLVQKIQEVIANDS